MFCHSEQSLQRRSHSLWGNTEGFAIIVYSDHIIRDAFALPEPEAHLGAILVEPQYALRD